MDGLGSVDRKCPYYLTYVHGQAQYILRMIIFIQLSALLYYRNLRLAENLETKTDSYSLSVRFQLKENFRAFKVIIYTQILRNQL